MPVDVAQLLNQDKALQALKWPWMEDWQDIADVGMPGQSDILSLRQAGTTRTRELYDTTFTWALDTFVANLSAWITNFSMQWFRLRMRTLRNDQAANAWLDDVARIQFENMTANEAPIPTAMNEAYRHYAGFGTGGLFIDEIPMGIRPQAGFRGYQAEALPVGHYSLAENASGRVDTFFRHFELSAHQMQDYPAWTLHQDTQDLLTDVTAQHRQWEPIKVLHAVFPRRDAQRGATDEQNMAWASVYVDIDHKHKLHEGGYPWFPAMFFRWEKLVRHNPFGFGRGHLVLPEAKTLQLIDRDLLRALPLSILPPGWLTGESKETVGRVSLLPGAMNPLAKGGAWVPYQSGQQFNAAQLQIAERRDRILRAFFIDQLIFLPPAEQKTQRTLGELQLRQRQMMRIMGPALMRLLPELLNPFIDITFALGLRANEYPEPPESVLEAAAREEGHIDVEFLGTLAQAQRSDEAEAVLEGLTFLTETARETGDVTVLRNVEMDETVARYLETRGFPQALVTDRRLMAEIRAEAERAAQNAQANEAGMAQAQIARDSAPLLREVNAEAN